MTARDSEADLIGHVRTHETCTPECDDFQRLDTARFRITIGPVEWADLIAEAEERGAARVRERVTRDISDEIIRQRQSRERQPDDQRLHITARIAGLEWAHRAALTDEAAP